MAAALDDLYRFGDVYDALDARDELTMRLDRLRRQHQLPEGDWAESKEHVRKVRMHLEAQLESDAS